MKEILIFAGTTEGRRLSECLAESGIVHTICVATEYGEIVLKPHPMVKVHRGRMNREEIREFITTGEFAAVVDATHPYAEVVTENIKAAMEQMDIPYLRLKRETDEKQNMDTALFGTNEECLKALEQTEGNILLTTGSKELGIYCTSENVKNRLYVRILPGMESLQQCMQHGISGKQILALQGPFSTQLNAAILRQYDIKYLVTKKSGKAGGFDQKLEAAQQCGTQVFIIDREKVDNGEDFRTVCGKLERICKRKITEENKYDIILAGTGMGTAQGLTGEVSQAVRNADILFGAKRLLEGFQPRIEKKPFYRSEQILPYLVEMQKTELFEGVRRVVILFSGDSGFYSGCQSLYRDLREMMEKKELSAVVRIFPGISSVSYLASCIGESYHDARICSMHGKEIVNLAEIIRTEKKTFLLMSGVKDVRRLGQMLSEAGLNDCVVVAGYQLSYPEQKIRELSPEECRTLEQEGLYICLIKNPRAAAGYAVHGMADAEFIRGKVPMTKAEVREVSICKMRLRTDSVLYDIGGGTGSVSIEVAGLSENITVYTIEQKEEAFALIEENKKKSGLENIKVIRGAAPEAMQDLPVPTHAFIGGSGGKLKEILNVLYQKNPKMRVVINAISLETISELNMILEEYPVQNEEIIQIQVNRTKKAGKYHLMQAENPVWICSFAFGEERENED